VGSDGPDEVDPGLDLIGRVVGDRYRVVSLLGAGGMGSAYLAEDQRMDRRVVLKVPHPVLLADPEFRKRFEAEIRSLTALEHPRVVKAIDVGAHRGVPFAVLQYLPGGSLEDRLVASGPVPPGSILRWLSGVAEALDFIHARGIVHRDVKPGNVLFDDVGHPFVSDLGIAKSLGRVDTGLTQTGQTPGSPEYIAPEVLSGAPVLPAYDQYSLGVVVYRALSGRFPFDGSDPLAVLVNKKTTPPVPLAQRAPGIPPAVADVVMRALDPDPARRFPSTGAFARAYAQAVRGTGPRPTPLVGAAPGSAPASPGSATPAPPTTPRRPLATRKQAIALAVATGALGAFVLFRALRPPRRDPPDAPWRVEIERPGERSFLSYRRFSVSGRLVGAATGVVHVNGRRAEVRGGRFDEVVETPGEGPFRVTVTASIPRAKMVRTWTRDVVVDETAPRVEILEPAAAVSVVAAGGSVRVRGRVVDANPAVVRRDGAAIPMSVDGSFETEVAVAPRGDTLVSFVAADSTTRESPPVTRTFRVAEAASAPATVADWSADLAEAKAASASGDWAAAAAALARAKEKGVPLSEIPALLADGVRAQVLLDQARALADAGAWDQVRGHVAAARSAMASIVVPKRIADGIAAHEKIQAAQGSAAAGDWKAARVLVDEAIALADKDAVVPDALARALAWRERMARAREKFAAGDWEAAGVLVDEARKLGASDDDVPSDLRDGIARYRTDPKLEVASPLLEGIEVHVPSFAVSLRLDSAASVLRETDEVKVVVAGREFVAGPSSWLRRVVTVPEPGTWVIEASVVDRGRVRASARRTVKFVRKPYTDALAGWAEPIAERSREVELDPGSGNPVRVLRLVDGAEMRFVPGGAFRMGAPPLEPGLTQEPPPAADERPLHTVTLTKPFYVDVAEVASDAFARFLSETGRPPRKGAGLAPGVPIPPVTRVTWEEAQAYATWARAELPTEAQHERAVDVHDWVVEPPKKAGEPPKVVGLRDVPWEWCADWYGKDYYGQSTARDPTGPRTGTERVLRGVFRIEKRGSRRNDPVEVFAPWTRSHAPPDAVRDDVGVRCVKTLP
jgi:formylglycine-generating enzyme required for sulfatase activity